LQEAVSLGMPLLANPSDHVSPVKGGINRKRIAFYIPAYFIGSQFPINNFLRKIRNPCVPSLKVVPHRAKVLVSVGAPANLLMPASR
jgi:hypothetical protein